MNAGTKIAEKSISQKNDRKTSNSTKNNLWENRYLLALLLPGIIYFFIFRYIPMYGILMAFQDFSLRGGVFGSEWVGLKHFQSIFAGGDFLTVLWNTFYISFLKILFGFPFPIILALMFNEIRQGPYKRITQTISYLPHFFSWVIMSGLLLTFLSPSIGLVNKVLQFVGVDPIFFLADKKWFVSVLVVSEIWMESGWNSVIFLAALAGVSPELHEAAMIDGATKLQRIIHINFPTILPTVAIMLILRMGTVLDAGFDQIFNLYTPPVYDVSDIIDTYIYRMGIGSYQYSFATAAGLFKALVGLSMVWFTNKLSKSLSSGEVSVW